MGTRAQNEKKFGRWEELASGRRRYSLTVQGRWGWRAVYHKEFDGSETTVRFWQEVLDEANRVVEIHEKFPVDKGHQKV